MPAGQRGLVEQVQHRGIAVGIADAEGGQEADGHPEAHDHPVHVVVELLDIDAVGGHQQAEVVVAHVAGDAVAGLGVLGQAAADAGQHHVPRLAAVPLVEQLELLQVDDDQHPVYVAVVEHRPGGVKEVVLPQKARQRIVDGPVVAAHAGDAGLPVLDVLDVEHIAVDQALGQLVRLAAHHHDLHPAPAALRAAHAALEVQHPGRLRIRPGQPPGQRIRVHGFRVGPAVLPVDQLVQRVVIEAPIAPLRGGNPVLVLDVV